MDSYRELIVWQKGKALAVSAYKITSLFPKDELYGLVSQVRRSAVSVPSNIAEGSGRRTTADFLQFLYVAKGSLFELQTQMDIARELKFLDEDKFVELRIQTLEIEKMLNSLIRKLKEKQ